ncbi:hypothetical protein R2F61_05160 [Mollicutes bacterium LVI A0078]|nr:hypothetical protein RZE84_05180 [Mollicutes bacterium LVI A0075]WOO90117.1 hypothetical protein R2F61_05160 [Mollicutes bacterium LVI A0078]
MKSINKFLLAVILLNIFYTPTVNGVKVASLLASETFHFDSVDSIDWGLLEVGDVVDLGVQNLNHFENYTFVNSDIMYDLVEYNPSTETINVDTDSSNDRRTAIFEPEYQLDLNQVAFFGTRFSTDVSTGILANRGYVSVMTRPNYNRLSENAEWGNSGTGENVWTLNADSNKLALKYRENGKYINTLNIPTNITFNTLSMSIDPENHSTSLSVCIKPDEDESYDCESGNATNVYTLTSKINSSFLDNEFVSIAYSPGVNKTNSTIHIEGISTIATVESYGEIHTKNPVVYVPLGTSLEEVHSIAEPRYNEFIDYVVTAVERDVPITDIVDNGGYNPNIAGRYLLRYNVTRGYEGGTPSTDTVSVEVYDPQTMINMSGEDTTMPVESAPINDQELISALSESAIDPQTEANLTDTIGIYNYGGFDIDNPTAGSYDITFYVADDYGKFIYDTHTLTLVNDFDINQLSQTVTITEDSTDDNKVAANDVLTVNVAIENTTNADLHNAQVEYLIDENYFDISSLSNVSGDMSAENITDSGLSKTNVDLAIGEKFEYQYQITAKDVFTISSNEQNLDGTTEYSVVSDYGLSTSYLASFPLAEELSSGIMTTLEVEDANNNQLLATSETVNIVATFTNTSDYSIPNIEIAITELTGKVDVGNLKVSSSVRPNVSEDSHIDGHDVVIDEIKPHEVITITETGVAKDYFDTEAAANFEAKYFAYSEDENVVYETSQTEQLDIDIATVSNINASADITDQNDELLYPGETFEVIFELENTGTILERDLEINLDLDDVNIATSELTASDVEMHFSKDGELTHETYEVDGTTIIIDKLQPGEKVSAIVNLRATNTFNADEYVNDLLAIAVTPEITITTPHELFFHKQLNLGLEHTGYANTNVNVHQGTGDGDNKIDSGETFEIVADVAVDGSMPLPNLEVAFDINTNNAAIVSDVEYIVLLEGTDITSEVSVYNDVVTIPNAKQGQHYKITAVVTYGNGASDTYSSNTVTMTHPYLTTQSRNANIQIDTDNLKNISFESTIDKTEVNSGDLVHVTTVIDNDGFTTENNLVLSLLGDTNNLILDSPQNIELSNGTFSSNGNQITINQLLPGESTTLQFDIKVADTLTIDSELGTNTKIDLKLNGKLSDNTQKNIDFSLSPIIGDVSIETSLNGVPLVGGNLVHTTDLVEYTYVLTNGNDVNLTNGTINFDISDQEIVSLDELKVVSSDPRFGYTIEGDNVLFTNLNAGQTVTVSGIVTTKDTFDQSPTIDFITNFTSDYISKTDTHSLAKDLENQSSIDANTNLISTSSGNMLVGKNETITYDVHIINNGSIDLEDIVVQTAELHENFTDEEIVSITTDNGEQFTDYVVGPDGVVTIGKLPVYEELTLTYELHTNDSIDYDQTLNVTTNISNEFVNQTVVLPLSVDLSHLGELDVHYSLEETDSDSDGKVDPGEINYIDVTITNTDSVVFNDVHVIDTMDDDNLESFFETVEIYDQDGNAFEDYTQDGNDVYIENFPGETTLTFRYKLQAKDTFTAANYVTISADVSANYPVEGVLTMPYTQTIPIDRANNMEFNATLDLENRNGNETLAPGDSVSATVTVNNTGTIDLQDVELIPDVVPNLDETTLEIALADVLNAEFVNNKIIIHDIPAGESETIKLNFDLDHTINGDDVFTVSGKVRSRLYTYDVSDSMPLDRSGSKLEASMDLLLEDGDEDGKVDPSEVYELDLVVANTGNTTLNNINIDVLELDQNIKSKTYIGANTTVTVDGDTKIIEKLEPGQEATLRYQVVIKDVLTSAEQIALNYLISQTDIEDLNVTVNKPIDVETNTSYTASLNVIDENEDGTAYVNEPLMYTYTFTNEGTRSLSDLAIGLDISDLNLDESSLQYKLYIDDTLQESVNYNPDTFMFNVPVVNPGEELKIEYTVNTTDKISSLSFLNSLYRTLNVKIESSVYINSADKTVSNNETAAIGVSKEVANISADSYITTTDGDNKLSALEEYTQTINVVNTGDVDTQRLLVRFSTSGYNMGTVTDLVVYDQDGELLEENTDYTKIDNVIEFENIPIGDSVQLIVSFKAPASLYSMDYVSHKAVVVPKYNNSLTVTDTMYTDITDRNIQYHMSHDLDGEIDEIIGKQDRMIYTIDNVGTINERNVAIDLHERTTDFIFDPSSLYIEKNGVEYNDYTLDSESMTVSLNEVNSGDQIVITSNVVIDADLNAQDDPVRDFYELQVIADAIYEDGTDEPIELYINLPKTEISTIDSSLKLSENIQIDGAIGKGEKVKGTLTIKNSNFLRQEHATIEIIPDNYVYEQGTLQVTSVKDQDGNTVDPSKYQVDGNVITLLDFRYGEEWKIVYKYNSKESIDFSQPITDEMLYVNDSVVIIDDALVETTSKASVKLSHLASRFAITGEAADESQNGKAAPGEQVEVTYQIENNGNYVEYLVPIQLQSGISNITDGEVTDDQISLSYEGKVRSNVDYVYDPKTSTVTIKQFNPGEVINVVIDYTLDDIITNQDTIHSQASVTSNLEKTKSKVIFMPTDLEEAEHMSVTNSLEDANQNNIIEDEEQLTYRLNLINEGNLNYMHTAITIDMENANALIDQQSFAVLQNGEVDTDYTVNVDGEKAIVDIYEFEVGENYEIVFNYSLDPEVQTGKTLINTNVRANHFNNDSSVVMRRDVETIEPEVPVNTSPVITYSDVMIDEGTVLTDEQLLAQVNATATDSEDGDLEVTYGEVNVDYQTPGEYDLELSVIDSYGLEQKETAVITIKDLLPTINVINNGEVIVGTQSVDYFDLLNISATEITDGDLTDKIEIDDSAVNLDVTGSYPISLSVVDDEGNSASATSSITVVRDLIDPDVIDPEVDGNYPPTISANDITINEEIELTNSELISLANVVVTDYEDSGLTPEIIANTIDYSMPGTYSLTFAVTDSGLKQTEITIDVTVVDLKPTITTESNTIIIPVGTKAVNYQTLFEMVATEITTGDLTSEIEIDDSAVNLDVTGIYELVASVTDEEGNKFVLPLNVNVVRSDFPDIDFPENGLNTLPQLSYTNIELDEHTVLTEEQLKSRIGATAYDGEDGELTVNYGDINVDYQVPGTYSIDLSVTDSSGAVVTANVAVVINDLLPQLTAGSELGYIEVGTESVDYIQLLGISATEVTNGDLTSEIVIDDSAVTLNVTGTYIVNFTVTDDEGNSAYLQAPVKVVRDLDNIDEIDGDGSEVEANVPPILRASDFTINEEMNLTDSQLITLANARANDYEDGILSVSVDHDIDFTTPGNYELRFSATDSGSKTSTVTVVVTVTDVLPVLTSSKTEIDHIVGSDSVDYISRYGLTATEINQNDLQTSITIDDSNVDYYQTGNYPVTASVADQEGNSASIDLTINIVRNLITDPDIEIPTIDPVEPVISGNTKATISEETYLTETELLELFNISYNEGAHLQFTADHNINYSKPGTYTIIFTNKDIVDPTNNMSITATLVIEDKKPILTNNEQLVIALNDSIDDYIQELNIVATEITQGDLTDKVEIDSTHVDSQTIGVYPLYLTVSDNEGNTVQNRVEVEVVNSLSPVITAQDVVLTSSQAYELSTTTDLVSVTNAIARDYTGRDITNDVEVVDVDNILEQTSFENGQQYAVELSVTNGNGRSDSQTVVITISDDVVDLVIKSNSPVVFALSENADLEEITARSHVRAITTINGEQTTEYLTADEIVSTNYVAGQLGLFLVKYQYTSDVISGTHDVIVYISEDGEMPDNVDVTIESAQNQHLIMPGDVYTESFTITNNSVRTKTMSSIKHSNYDQNISGVSSIQIIDSYGNIIANTSSKTRMATVINDLEIPSGEQYTINVNYATNELFTYRTQLDTSYQIEFDGEVRTVDVNTKVDPKAIDVDVVVNLDKELYYAGDNGTLYFELENNGTMDTMYSLLTVDKNLTNIKLGQYRVDGLIVDENNKVMIPAQDSLTVEIDFKVNNNVVIGDDIISIFDDLDHELAITIPVQTVTEGDDTETSTDEADNTAETDTTAKESTEESEASDAKEDEDYKFMEVLSTGSNTIIAILVITLVVLITLKKVKFTK